MIANTPAKMFHTMTHISLRLALCACVAGVMGIAAARADDQPAAVARISVLRGDVSLQRADSGDTVAATVNAPVTIGDYVVTGGSDSRAEVQLDAYDVLRLAANTQVRFSQLGVSADTVQIAAGTMELRVFKMAGNPQVETPSITLRAQTAGRYRISVDDQSNTIVSVRAGSLALAAPQGTQVLDAGLSVEISGPASNPVIRPIAAITYDDFDAWNAQRDSYDEQAFDDPHINAAIVGAGDLSAYGHWVFVASYGYVWVPWGVAVGWAPYHDGQWVWEPYYGWTWVDDEPWGWAPFHYGRWFWAPGYGWAWYPGPVYVRPVYSPALVAFFGFGGGGFGFSLAFGNVGWVPLAPFEPFHPWWGPTIVNRTVVYNITNVNIVNVYRNVSVPNAVAVVSRTNFTAGGTYHYLSVRTADLRAVAVARGPLPIVPTRANLSAARIQPGSVRPLALSGNFRRLTPPAHLPPSFDTQRAAVQTALRHMPAATERFHPIGAGTQHGSDGAAGASGTAWDRFNANRHTAGPSGGAAGFGAGHGAANGVSSSSSPWDKFSPRNNVYTHDDVNTANDAKRTGSRHTGAKAKPHHPPKNTGQGQ
jgi:hypothetical protein